MLLAVAECCVAGCTHILTHIHSEASDKLYILHIAYIDWMEVVTDKTEIADNSAIENGLESYIYIYVYYVSDQPKIQQA